MSRGSIEPTDPDPIASLAFWVAVCIALGVLLYACGVRV